MEDNNLEDESDVTQTFLSDSDDNINKFKTKKRPRINLNDLKDEDDIDEFDDQKLESK
jgi:hypothetical protein